MDVFGCIVWLFELIVVEFVGFFEVLFVFDDCCWLYMGVKEMLILFGVIMYFLLIGIVIDCFVFLWILEIFIGILIDFSVFKIDCGLLILIWYVDKL